MDATRSLIDLTCHECGEMFQRLRYEHAKKIRQGRTRWYCSHACAADALRTGGKPCVVCGTPTGSKDRRRFYCSAACKATTRPAKATKACPRCGVIFAYSSRRRVYCTKACADRAHAVRMVGRGNSRYKDGSSYADWFRKTRPLIIERDGGCCVVCSKAPTLTYRREGRIVRRSAVVIHHLDEVPSNNRPANLVALCITCHAVHHKSAVSPFPWFADYAAGATAAMPAAWQAAVRALADRYSGEAERERVGSSG